LLLTFAVACRIQPAGIYWIEAHGRGQLTSMVASPRGVIGIGLNGIIYRTPGTFGNPWPELARVPARALAASPAASYVLDHQKYVWRLKPLGRPQRVDGSVEWQADFIAADEMDRLFVISNGEAKAIEAGAAVPVACADRAIAIAPARAGLYLLTEEGAIRKAVRSACETIESPGPVTSLAAFDHELAIVVGGVPHRRKDGRWQELPRPRRYRDTEVLNVDVAQVAVSRNTLWGRDPEGFVYVLSDAS
jgi:hypothetical protein